MIRSDIKIDGETYMRRWLLGRPKGSGVRLHHILRSDDRHFHDHPFDFTSIILRGSYTEWTPIHGTQQMASQLYTAGDIIQRKAEDLHFLTLENGPVWTLVFRGPYRRTWGFWDYYNGWVDFRFYQLIKGREKYGTDGLSTSERMRLE